jgi:Uma2 family endonuclease
MQHQEIVLFLAQVIGFYVERRALGKIVIPPFQMKLPRRGREPDLIFVAQEHLERLRGVYLEGPADLVVEIISPESIGRDRGEKFFEYESAGIPEFWLIDPFRKRVEFYQLDTQGTYQLVSPDKEGIYHSQSIAGFWIRVFWLWRLPLVWDVLRELGLV